MQSILMTASNGQLPAVEHTFVLVNTLGHYRAGGNLLTPSENHKTVLFNIAKAIYVYCSIEKEFKNETTLYIHHH
jgi:hypothetical protein